MARQKISEEGEEWEGEDWKGERVKGKRGREQRRRRWLVRLKARVVREVKVLFRYTLSTCNQLQRRRREARWRTAGGERPVRRLQTQFGRVRSGSLLARFGGEGERNQSLLPTPMFLFRLSS